MEPEAAADPRPPRSLTSSAAWGARWGALRSVVLQLLTVVSTMVLARILTPADFGLVAAATVVVGMFKLLTTFGFGASLVRRAELNEEQISTIFWIATGAGALALVSAAALANPLSRLIGQPNVVSMILVLASLIPLGLASNIGRSLLIRDLRFRATAIVEIGEVAVYLSVAITLALVGFGPWAIVIGYVAESVFRTVSLFLLARWRPRFQFDGSLVRDELAFSGGVLGNTWLRYLNGNLDYWVVSAVLGAEALGAYYVAYVIPNIVRQRFTSIAQEVLYPILAKMGENIERVKFAYLRVVRVVAFITLPAMAGVAVLSDLIVRLGFGERWDAAMGPLPILAIAAAVMSVSVVGGPITTAAGRPYLLIPANVAGVITLGVGLAITASTGSLTIIAWSVVVAAVVTAIGRHVIVGRLIKLKLSEFMSQLLPIVVASLSMTGVLLPAKWWVVATRLPLLMATLTLVGLGILIYLATFWTLFRSQLREQVRSMRAVMSR